MATILPGLTSKLQAGWRGNSHVQKAKASWIFFFSPLARKMIVFPKGYTHKHFCFIFHWPKLCHMTAVTGPAARWPVQFGFSIGHCCCLTCNPVSAPWVYQEHTLNRICLYWYNHLFYVLPYHLELSFSVIEIQNLSSHLRPAESETLGLVIFSLSLSKK